MTGGCGRRPLRRCERDAAPRRLRPRLCEALSGDARSAIGAQSWLSKPYLVIWNPSELVGAWYDRTLTLRANEISAQLLAFARAHACTAHPWNDLPDIDLPAWAAEAPLDDCVCFWLYDDGYTPEQIARIPDR